MPLASKKKHYDDLSSSGVSSLSGSNQSVKKITIYRNGDIHYGGLKLVVNPRHIPDMDRLLAVITDRIDLPYGAKKLYSANGKQIKTFADLQDGKIYIASSNTFTPMTYGDSTRRAWKPSNKTVHDNGLPPVLPKQRMSRSLEPKPKKSEVARKPALPKRSISNKPAPKPKAAAPSIQKKNVDIFIPHQNGGHPPGAKKKIAARDASPGNKPIAKKPVAAKPAKPKPVPATNQPKPAPAKAPVPKKAPPQPKPVAEKRLSQVQKAPPVDLHQEATPTIVTTIIPEALDILQLPDIQTIPDRDPLIDLPEKKLTFIEFKQLCHPPTLHTNRDPEVGNHPEFKKKYFYFRDEYHGQISAKKINVFKNGDPYHKGIKVVITSRMHDFDVLLNTISEKIDLSHGAKRIFTTAGKQVKAIKDLEDGKDYVASSGHFSPLKYGSSPIARKPRSPSRKKREKKSTDERPDTVRTTQSTQPRPKKKKKVPKKRAHSTSPRLEKSTPSDTVVSDTVKKVKHTGKKLRETANNAAHDGNEVVKKKVKKVKKSTKSAAEKAAKIPSAVAAGAVGAVSGAIVGASEKMTGKEKAKERKHTPSPTRYS
ncbi:hypothetical protein WR25_24203 isoform B [Diploscapter pachys]|uniref:Doublecortin domain-containing protein n=1 Tax=Diploscapter pachys TaxID=2018661 RepID=A0A2A2LXH7_9BILA|nr:hypothetical protein WR25_24203 isoform A [Diploscapter pachys]PAV90899.1 hypothetical protein WR25_24203 isoform B [Diploscapter pachys]